MNTPDKKFYYLSNFNFLVLLLTLISLSSSRCKEDGRADNNHGPVDSVKLLYPIEHTSLRARDPFITVDASTKTYYLTVSNRPSFRVYSSKDLKNWKIEGNSFTGSEDFWGKDDYWAPDVYQYKGKYYLFATFSAPGVKRGTSILEADKVVGPYYPLVNKAITPANWMCLDGSLFVDPSGTPWIIYCHEWLEVVDGEVMAQQLSEDLKQTVGEPKVLFRGSSAPWAGTIQANGVTGYVTDAPFVYKAKNGELLMLWSSFTKTGKYAIGLARSESGNILGPWKQDTEPLNKDDGGHAMLFTDLSGQLRISYHAPNSLTERPVFYKVTETQGKLTIENN